MSTGTEIPEIEVMLTHALQLAWEHLVANNEKVTPAALARYVAFAVYADQEKRFQRWPVVK